MLCWNTGIIPTDWKRGLVVPLWKEKVDRQDCNKYQGVTLLSVPGKVFSRIILDWVRHHLLEHQRPEQPGFTPKRSTIDRILALRILTERRRGFRQGLLADGCETWTLTKDLRRRLNSFAVPLQTPELWC